MPAASRTMVSLSGAGVKSIHAAVGQKCESVTRTASASSSATRGKWRQEAGSPPCPNRVWTEQRLPPALSKAGQAPSGSGTSTAAAPTGSGPAVLRAVPGRQARARMAAAAAGSTGMGQPAVQQAPEWRQAKPAWRLRARTGTGSLSH